MMNRIVIFGVIKSCEKLQNHMRLKYLVHTQIPLPDELLL